MPYFSFSLKQTSLNSALHKIIIKYNLEPNIKYFSKNTKIWSTLNKKNASMHLNSLQYEKMNSFLINKSSVLFLMPPSIGLGDAIEYAISLKSILEKNIFKKIGIGFVYNYKFIFNNLFKFNNVFENTITEKDLISFDTTFHFSKEIKKIHYQKYYRSNIEKEICDFFNINIKKKISRKFSKIKKITLFPISTSPIRTMPVEIINSIISNFNEKIEIEIVLDKFYSTSEYILSNIKLKNSKLIFHNKLEELFDIVKSIDYGIFIDSGPLHLAKLLNKSGLFIETSVSHQILLHKFKSIKFIKNSFCSDYCEAPCGLTNLFNLNNSAGCYQTHKISKYDLDKNKTTFQRGNLKKSYNHFMSNPVGCVKNIDLKKILNTIKESI